MPKWTSEQLEAISKAGENIIVSAGAGSGKTAVLTERVLEKLKSGIKINELLILTFTNAAAGEMKERIRKKILNEPSLIENLDYLDMAYITTFDSYSLSLVKKYHYLLNVSKDLSIVDNSVIEIVKKNILDKVFEEFYESNDANFLKLVDDFCLKNDTSLKNSIMAIFKSLELISDKDYFISSYFEKYFSEIKIEEYINNYNNLLKAEITNIETNLYYLSDSDYPEYYEKMIECLNPLIKSETYDEIKKNVNISLPRRPKNSEDVEEYKENISASLTNLKKMLRYKDSEEIVNSLKISKNYVQAILEIYKCYIKKLNDYKKEYDLYEFTDIELMAISILKNNQEIRNEIKYFYQEICVDEYQDTNDLQEEFINLIENNNVYMVGDIKQSIYGFRNANPKIFKNKYDLYAKHQGGYKIDLLKNFRSRSEVLEGINNIFNLIMDDAIGGASYQSDHQMVFGNMNYEENKAKQNYDLEIYNYSYEDKEYQKEEIESFIIGKDILKKINNYQVLDSETNKLRNAQFKDFCIILDRGSSFSTYIQVFDYLGIPLQIYEDKKLTTEYDILVIKNLLKLILCIKRKDYKEDFRYAFFSVARSFLFMVDDDTLYKYFQNNTFYETELFKKCQKIANKIEVGNNYEILNLVINEFNIYEKLIRIGNIDEGITRINHLLNISKNMNNIGSTFADFVTFLDDILKSNIDIKYQANNESGNSVKLMNIHKSKGLEFPICYFAGYHKPFNTQDIKARFLYNSEYGIITPYYDKGVAETILKELYKEKYKIDDISERIRLLYVALTRAKEKMIIVTSLDEEHNHKGGLVDYNIRSKYNSFLSIINSIKDSLESYITNISLTEVGLTKDYLINKFMKDENNSHIKEEIIFKENNIPNNIIENKRASKTITSLITENDWNLLEHGTKIHEELELTDFHSENKIIKSLKEKLNITNEAQIIKEHEFIFEYHNNFIHGIIDLVIIEKDVIKIVDYKLKNISDEKYQEQLDVYYRYVRNIYPDKQIKLYLYSIILDEVKEVDYEK